MCCSSDSGTNKQAAAERLNGDRPDRRLQRNVVTTVQRSAEIVNADDSGSSALLGGAVAFSALASPCSRRRQRAPSPARPGARRRYGAARSRRPSPGRPPAPSIGLVVGVPIGVVLAGCCGRCSPASSTSLPNRRFRRSPLRSSSWPRSWPPTHWPRSLPVTPAPSRLRWYFGVSEHRHALTTIPRRLKSRLGESIAAVRDVVVQPQLRRAELAFAWAWTGECAFTVGLGVVAFRDGGAAAVGVVALMRMVPAAVVSPFSASSPTGCAGTCTRDGVRVRALPGAAAVLLAAGAPSAGVYALAVLATIASTVFRPPIPPLPSLCDDGELTSANVVRVLDSLGRCSVRCSQAWWWPYATRQPSSPLRCSRSARRSSSRIRVASRRPRSALSGGRA